MKKLILIAIAAVLLVGTILAVQTTDYRERVVKCIKHERRVALVKYIVVGTVVGAAVGVATLTTSPAGGAAVAGAVAATTSSMIFSHAASGAVVGVLAYIPFVGIKRDKYMDVCIGKTGFWN